MIDLDPVPRLARRHPRHRRIVAKTRRSERKPWAGRDHPRRDRAALDEFPQPGFDKDPVLWPRRTRIKVVKVRICTGDTIPERGNVMRPCWGLPPDANVP